MRVDGMDEPHKALHQWLGSFRKLWRSSVFADSDAAIPMSIKGFRCSFSSCCDSMLGLAPVQSCNEAGSVHGVAMSTFRFIYAKSSSQ